MNLQENILRIKEVMGLTEDFNWEHANHVVTQKYSKEIYELLLKMFPKQSEIIDYHYNDEFGQPFAEWRKKIHDIKDWKLKGPINIDPNDIHIDEESYISRKQKFDDYISGKENKYFRKNEGDPRNIDFSKLPPVTLERTLDGYNIDDGNHRVFLAKMMNKPLKAYVWVKEPNNSPYVNQIEKLFH